jgi:HPt (histidine-containing phosphotransfer) domain-containing protein
MWAPDVTVINVVEGLKIWTDMPAYQDWLSRFVGLYAESVPLMRSSLAVSDSMSAVALAHKLAGVAANLALPEVFRTAAEAERVLGSDLDPVLALAELASAMESAVVTIRRMTAA